MQPKSLSDLPPSSGFKPWIESLLGRDLGHFEAYLRAIQPIQARIAHDATKSPEELWGLLREVDLRLGDPRLNAASARRGAGIRDPSILRRFRRHVGVSLSGYIRERRMETVTRLAYTSDVALEDIAAMFGFASADALARAIGGWVSPATLAELREGWAEWDGDYVVWRWFMRGEASPEQARQMFSFICRRNPSFKALAEEEWGIPREPGDPRGTEVG